MAAIHDSFQYTDFIQNMCESEYQTEALRQSSPHTYLVHSKVTYLFAYHRLSPV
jgi:hypothetical protein